MLKAILVDDEKASLTSLKEDLKDYCPNIIVKAVCQSPLMALKAISKYEPDIVFLDIEMPGMTGFEMLEVIGDVNFFVIFIASSRDYAFDAFKIRNANYLNKPIEPDKLEEAVKRVEEQIALTLGRLLPSGDITSKIPCDIQWIPFQVGIDYFCIKRQDIIYFQANGDHTFLFINDYKKYGNKSRIHLNDGLGLCEKRLNTYNEFFRIHHGYLVNLNHVVCIKNKTRKIQLSNGEELSISVKKWPGFLNFIKGEDL